MPAAAQLRIYYRSHGAENAKARPDYYSKHLALTSLLRAAAAVHPRPELVFVNDGPLPEDRLALMRTNGRIVSITEGGNRGSYRTTVALAARESAADDLVWFAEDDYLYTAAALRHLQAAAAEPEGDYFSLYGSTPLHTGEPGRHGAAVGDVAWFRAMSTTSTFGVRGAVLHADVGLLRLCPFSGGAWDRTTCRVVQGRHPFSLSEIAADLRGSPRTVARAVVRGVVAARAMRLPSRRRVLLASDPPLIEHMEQHRPDPSGVRRPPEFWERLAAEARRYPVPS